MKKTFYIFIIALAALIALAMPSVSAAHYVVGIVNDARDGATVNGRNLVLWNPANGIDDNQTDIIGLEGNSGIDNVYMIDCELLNNPCNIGDSLKVRVLDNGDGRVSYDADVIVTGAGYDIAPELTLNSFPSSSLISPVNHANISSADTIFNCSATDLDSNLDSVTLYGNWSGGEWGANETKSISGGSYDGIFIKQIPEGNYEWNCLASDNLSLSSFANNNFSFTIDRTPPNINAVQINQSFVCGTSSYIRVNCTANDNHISSVIIQAIKPDGIQNYSTQKIFDYYYSDIPADAEGIWRFNCIAKDSAGNAVNLTSSYFYVYAANPDLQIFSNRISFSDYDLVENEEVFINANISNQGCGNSPNLLVGFYNGDPDISGIQIGNKTISITGLSNESINLSWIPVIGTSNIFIIADLNNSFSEVNESDNKANNTITLGSWQQFFGNVSLNKLISDSSLSNMSVWSKASKIAGNIFMSNKGSSVNWNNLQALGKNKTGGNSSNDFSNADVLLGMSNFSDSIYKIYTDNGQVDKTDNFTVFNKDIFYVPIVNSTNNSNFITGILWDTTTDTNGYFDQSDKEPLVFITKVNMEKLGAYGSYDYEFKIPALLRSYNSTDNCVYLYYELV